jgi:hypothetical protein
MMDEYGAFSGVRIGIVNRSTRRKLTPVPKQIVAGRKLKVSDENIASVCKVKE